MGSYWSYITTLGGIFEDKKARILIVGLDNAGKTTIFSRLRLDRNTRAIIDTSPTIGFNVETLQYKQVTFTMWDVGGQQKIRPLWKQFYKDADAVIFVVDSNDRARLTEASEELEKMMSDDLLENAWLLIFANKSDMRNAMKSAEICDGLKLRQMADRKWYIQPSVATTGQGLFEGLEWIARAVGG
jgi:ADP-ribosylation factor protein 1